MSIQPVVGLPGVYPPKLSVRREIFLHPDRVSYRYSGRFLHKHAKDWEDLESPNTLKAGTLLALRKIRFPGDSQAKLYWFPFVLTANHTASSNRILLPESFKSYAYMFGNGSMFLRVRVNGGSRETDYSIVTANGNPVASDQYLEIPIDPSGGVGNSGWADNSVLVYLGLNAPTSTESIFSQILAFSVLPGDTLVSDTHTQLHHYPWSGIVKGDMLYPRSTQWSSNNPVRNSALKRVVKAFAERGLTGLLVDEYTFE